MSMTLVTEVVPIIDFLSSLSDADGYLYAEMRTSAALRGLIFFTLISTLKTE